MCLISVLPKGTKKYSNEVTAFIEQGFNCNTDGSGYMYKRHNSNTITIKKGFVSLNRLMESLAEAKLEDNDELVVHHRIRTLGYVNDKNCHPFVISENEDEISAVDITIDKPCLAHNGTIKELDQFEYVVDYKYSDTYIFSRFFLGTPQIMDLLKTKSDYFSLLFKNILNNSRVAILFPDRDILMLGDFVLTNGYYHSNEGYCRKVHNYGGYNYRTYDDYDVKSNNIITEYVEFDTKDVPLTNTNFKKLFVVKDNAIWNNQKLSFDILYQIDSPVTKNDTTISLKRDKVFYTYINLKSFYNDYVFIVPRYTLTGDFNSNWLIYTDYKVILTNVKRFSENVDKLESIKEKFKNLLEEYKHNDKNMIIEDTIFSNGYLYLEAYRMVYKYCLLKLKELETLKTN